MPARARQEPSLYIQPAGGAVTRYRIVKLSAGVITHAVVGELSAGVAQGSGTAPSPINVMSQGRTLVEGSAAIPAGSQVSPGPLGKARVTQTGDAVVGVALEACTGDGDLFLCDVDPAGTSGGGGGGGLPPVTGNDGYAVIEVGSVAAFRPILASYVVPAFDISAFNNAPGTQEVGATVTNPVSLTAAYNRTPDNADVVDNQGNPSLDVTATPTAFTYPHAYTKTANNDSVVFTLTASEGAESDVATSTIAWRPRAYFGVGVDGLSTEADIEALPSNALQSSRVTSFAVSPGSGQHIYYAYPDSYGAGTFFIGGFEGGFVLVGTVSVTNAHGVTQNYRLYKSVQANLGSVTVSVT